MEKIIQIYGTNSCSDCIRSKYFLESHKIPYTFIDITGNDEAIEFVLKTNDGMQSIPVIVLPDGSTLTEPTNQELAKSLGL